MRLGGESDPRNKSLMKMFNLINIGERAGSGEYSNAIVHAFQKFRAPFSGKIVHIFPEQSAVI